MFSHDISDMSQTWLYSKTGACIYIQRGIGEPLMWFPCTHHILELIVGAMVHQHWPTSGPVDAIYLRFKNEWPGIWEKLPEIEAKAGEKVNSTIMLLITSTCDLFDLKYEINGAFLHQGQVLGTRGRRHSPNVGSSRDSVGEAGRGSQRGEKVKDSSKGGLFGIPQISFGEYR